MLANPNYHLRKQEQQQQQQQQQQYLQQQQPPPPQYSQQPPHSGPAAYQQQQPYPQQQYPQQPQQQYYNPPQPAAAAQTLHPNTTVPVTGSPYQSPHHSPQPSLHNSRPASPNAMSTRTLHLYSPSRKEGSILDANKTTQLYTYRSHSSSHTIEFYAGHTGQLVGTVRFHSFSSRIDVVVRGRAFELGKNGFMKSGHCWSSGALGGRKCQWKTEGWGHGLACYVDGGAGVLARYERSSWAMKKDGKMHLHGQATVPGPLMDEVVITGIAELVTQKQAASASAAAGGAAGAAGGGGGG